MQYLFSSLCYGRYFLHQKRHFSDASYMCVSVWWIDFVCWLAGSHTDTHIFFRQQNNERRWWRRRKININTHFFSFLLRFTFFSLLTHTHTFCWLRRSIRSCLIPFILFRFISCPFSFFFGFSTVLSAGVICVHWYASLFGEFSVIVANKFSTTYCPEL